MITLLGVLLIIGSCSSSKSVNTSEVTVGDGKLEVIFAPQFTYQDMVITLWKYNSSTGSYVKQGYADIDAPMLLSSSDTMKITGTFRYSSGGTTVTDYINDFPLDLAVHYSVNRRKITYKIYNDGSIFPTFN
jgi:hypothetical protein